ncbi:SEL1-like repeat protein [Kitasatospora cheerisanensis]|uniref:SEL1-like repeat protein n=1 Tax=Kitasatospora cheerisanensis TaxID=81942 RepID=UPI0012ED4DE1|nr:SEL1-like repeat protein [Kitasatospora cheerisanensis]
MREATGRTDETVVGWEQGGAVGEELAWQEAAAPFARHGQCWEQPRFAYLGDPQTLRERAEQCERDRDVAGALHWYREAAGAGSEAALFQAADMLERNGDRVRAVHWYELAARRGDVYAMRELGRLLADLGRTRESAAWHRVAVRAGGRPELPEPVRVVEPLDRRPAPAAEAVATRPAGQSAPADAALLAAAVELLKDGGRYFEADLLLRSANRPEPEQLREASRMLYDSVTSDGAIEWVQRFADTGDRQAVREAAEMLENRGRTEEALDWYARAAADGDRDALVAAARMLADRRQVQHALDWYRRAAEAGVQTAEREASMFRQQVDAAEERALRRRREREQRALAAAPTEVGGVPGGPVPGR